MAFAEFDAVAVFDRDPATGALAQKLLVRLAATPRTASLRWPGRTAVDAGRGVVEVPTARASTSVSQGFGAVAVFDATRRLGALARNRARLPGALMTEWVAFARTAGSSTTPWVAASEDGKSVDVGSLESDVVVVFDVASASPAAPLGGRGGRRLDAGLARCEGARAMNLASGRRTRGTPR